MLGGCRCSSISHHSIFNQFSSIFFTVSSPTSNSSFNNFKIKLRKKNSSSDTSSYLSNKVSNFGANCVRPKSSDSQSSLLSETLSQSGTDEEPPSERLPILAGGIVALGKFDALHIGHRELAIQAAKRGIPFLLSFVGMAEVLGWEPRVPIVAACDRKRILSSWAPYCGNVIPRELQIDFSKVRNLTPRQFVEKLSKELGVRGVVAGENYRFGYRAAGDVSDLVKLCDEFGLEAYIINSVMDTNQISGALNSRNGKERGQVSSTRVRYALDKGDMKYVSELLGRSHRLVLIMEDQERFSSERNRLSAPKSCLLNLAPKEGVYENCSASIDKNVIPCRVIIDTTDIHFECYEVANFSCITSRDLKILGIDFGSPELDGVQIL
ncbi:FAD synthetase 2, chloroplastic [Capsicum baccatum]|uniref:FAD synthase n=1 Tax=Capsicum baccatum TaxID=33114 RepID=A0A2G2X9G0_CAPBA|nr:FAD synthetase 2, chloroplastic [Capsicum baccatum]